MASLSITSRVRPTKHLVGVRGGSWHAVVNERGAIWPSDGSPVLNWYVAADDRWHDPSAEGTVRQERRGGIPVIETRLRVPGGDVVQRVYGTVEHGGLIVIELENQSTLPVVVALTRGDILAQRPASSAPISGISLPEGSVAFPIGHKATLKLALAASGTSLRHLPGGLVDAEQLRRGWSTALDRASRLVLPDREHCDAVARIRADLLIDSGIDFSELASDPAAYVLTLVELQRLGEKIDQHVVGLVDAVESLLATNSKKAHIGWDVERALFGSQRLFHGLDETRAVADVAASHFRLGQVTEESTDFLTDMPPGIRGIAWLEDQLVSLRRDGTAAIFSRSIPNRWLGVDLEAHSLMADATRSVSCALRWHGEHPALLWEVVGPPGLHLSAGRFDPTWSSNESTGETLLSGFSV
ncbi:MAG: hypothetical protein ABI570_06350 [Ilumatobacteraceae bacterium]